MQIYLVASKLWVRHNARQQPLCHGTQLHARGYAFLYLAPAFSLPAFPRSSLSSDCGAQPPAPRPQEHCTCHHCVPRPARCRWLPRCGPPPASRRHGRTLHPAAQTTPARQPQDLGSCISSPIALHTLAPHVLCCVADITRCMSTSNPSTSGLQRRDGTERDPVVTLAMHRNSCPALLLQKIMSTGQCHATLLTPENHVNRSMPCEFACHLTPGSAAVHATQSMQRTQRPPASSSAMSTQHAPRPTLASVASTAGHPPAS